MDIDLGHEAEGVFVTFLYSKVTLLYPISVLSSLEGCHDVQPILKDWGVMFDLFEGRTVM